MTTLSNSDYARDIAFHLHPQTNLKLHEVVGPTIITEGRGARVIDLEGREYLDGVAGLWCATLGYSDAALVDAATAQLHALPYFQSFAHRSHQPVIELSDMLITRAPVPMSKVIYASSGSEANETAIKLAWYYQAARGAPGRRKIIARRRAYHGSTIVAASLTGLPNMHNSFGLPLEGVIHLTCPHFYRSASPDESETEFLRRLEAELEETIAREGAETIAAFIAEPVMGTGGVIVPPPRYFERIQPILRSHDILFIADEVICGFGRTGHYWGSQAFGIEPDLLTCAKGLTGAYAPLSATLVNERLYEVIRDESGRLGVFGHGFTYGAHPLGAAVAIAALKRYDEIDVVERTRSLGAVLQRELVHLADHPLVGEVRGIGLMAGVELVRDKESRDPFDPTMKVGLAVQSAAEERGVILRALGDTVVFAPPYVCAADDIAHMVAVFGEALDVVGRNMNVAR